MLLIVDIHPKFIANVDGIELVGQVLSRMTIHPMIN